MMEILPDCRAKEIKGRVFVSGVSWIPVFCANCGADGGLCPEENMTFMFYLCNRCAETHGQILGTMLMPDEVFFEKLRQEQLNTYGRYLTQEELIQIADADDTPLAKLLKAG